MRGRAPNARARWDPSVGGAAARGIRGDDPLLKKGLSEEAAFEADRNVRETVEAILEDISARGDTAVRELSATLRPAGSRSSSVCHLGDRALDRQPARSR